MHNKRYEIRLATAKSAPYRRYVIVKRIDETTTIKVTENYRNDRTTYKLNSGLFSDTTVLKVYSKAFILCFIGKL